jgi:cation transport protein ChaC
VNALTHDAFRHLPGLRDKLTPAEQSALRVTPQVLAFWDERARAQGRPADWRWSDRQIEASRQAALGRLDLRDGLWVYGYGSLMWDPGVHFAEIRLAALDGHQRRFNFQTSMARGTVEQPALMLSLEAAPAAARVWRSTSRPSGPRPNWKYCGGAK